MVFKGTVLIGTGALALRAIFACCNERPSSALLRLVSLGLQRRHQEPVVCFLRMHRMDRGECRSLILARGLSMSPATADGSRLRMCKIYVLGRATVVPLKAFCRSPCMHSRHARGSTAKKGEETADGRALITQFVDDASCCGILDFRSMDLTRSRSSPQLDTWHLELL